MRGDRPKHARRRSVNSNIRDTVPFGGLRMWNWSPALTLLLAAALVGCQPGESAPVPDQPQVPLRGLDPVMLLTGEEVPGVEDHSTVHGRFRYLFSSVASLARFEARPQRYAIRFDGQCARMQGGIQGNPDLFAVHAGRIYIFGSPGCMKAFKLDPEGYLEQEPEAAPAPAKTESASARLSLADGSPVAQTWTGESGYSPDDWPQWGGLHRNFKSPATGLASRWPAKGPRRLWERELGDGFSSIAVEGGRLYTLYRRNDHEVVVSVDAANGRTLWEYEYEAPFTDHYKMEYGPGPHATPLVAGNLVFAVGATSIVHALDKITGLPAWRHDLIDEFDATIHRRGYASSPLIYKDTVIVTAGGTGSAIVAFRRTDGTVVWKSQDSGNSPASPIIVDVDGRTNLVAFMSDAVVGIDPEDGRRLWSLPHETDWGLNASTPVWHDDHRLFVSSAYGGGSRLIRLERQGDGTTAHEAWFTNRMRIHFGNAIRLGDFVFGSSGDFGLVYFAAVNVNTGELVWRERGLGRASFVYADGRFVILDEDGDLTLATPTADGLRIHSRVELLSHVAWTVPALSGTTLFVRDRKMLLALDLG